MFFSLWLAQSRIGFVINDSVLFFKQITVRVILLDERHIIVINVIPKFSNK